MIGLGGIGDHTYRRGQHAGFTADLFRGCGLVSRSNRYLYSGKIAAGRTVKQINAEWLKRFGKHNGIFYSPAADHPIRGGDSYPERILLRPDVAYGGHHLTHDPHAVGERTSIVIRAMVGERRKKRVQQITVGCVEFNQLGARSLRPACRRDKRFYHGNNLRDAQGMGDLVSVVERKRAGSHDRNPSAFLRRNWPASFPGFAGAGLSTGVGKLYARD